MVKIAPEDQPDVGEPSPAMQQERAGREQPAPTPLKDTGYRGVFGRLSNAVSFVHKSVRDLPILLKEVRPLRREKVEIERRVKGIISDCLAILQAVGEADAVALMRW